MAKERKNDQPAGIFIENSTDGVVTNNRVEGYERGIAVSHSRRIDVGENDVQKAPSERSRWRSPEVLIGGVAVLVAVVFGVLAVLHP